MSHPNEFLISEGTELTELCKVEVSFQSGWIGIRTQKNANIPSDQVLFNVEDASKIGKLLLALDYMHHNNIILSDFIGGCLWEDKRGNLYVLTKVLKDTNGYKGILVYNNSNIARGVEHELYKYNMKSFCSK